MVDLATEAFWLRWGWRQAKVLAAGLVRLCRIVPLRR